MARTLDSVIASNRKNRKSQLGFIESIEPLVKSQGDSVILLEDISNKLNDIDKNTESLKLLGQTIKVLTQTMGSFVDVFNKDIESRKTSDFFAGALAKEKEIESKFKTISPTKVKETSTETKNGGLSLWSKILGGALLGGGILGFLIKSQDFRNAISGFFGKIFELIGEGLGGLYDFAKEWINKKENQAIIGNIFTGILNSISKAFELAGDLANVLVKEYEKEDSPLKKAVNGILESLWGFVGEHPLIALGGALYTFSGLLPALVGALVLANTTIGKAIGAIGLAVAAFEGGRWLGEKISELLGDYETQNKEERKSKKEIQLQEIEKISDPELKKQVTQEIKSNIEKTTGTFEGAYQEEHAVNYAYLKYQNKIEEDKQKQVSEKAKNNSQTGTQPVVAGSGVTPGTIPPPSTPYNLPTTPTISPERQKEIAQMEDESALWHHEPQPQQKIPTKTPDTTQPQKVSENWQAMGSDLDGGETGTKPTREPSQIKESDKGRKSKTGIKINEEYAMSFFMGRGWTREQSAGIVSNLIAESNLDTGALNPDSKAAGIAQWLSKSRVNLLKQRYEVSDVRNATPDQQLDFVDWELKNTHKNAGQMLKKSKDPVESASIIMKYYEIPSEKEQRESFPRRKNNALRLSKGGYSNIESEALGTPGKVSEGIPTSESPFKFELSGKGISTEGSESPMSLLEDIVFGAMTNQDLIGRGTLLQKIRSLPSNLINQPKVSGDLLNLQSIDLFDSKNKTPEVTINAPNINKTDKSKATTTSDNAMISVFDKEFIELLTSRTVDIFVS